MKLNLFERVLLGMFFLLLMAWLGFGVVFQLRSTYYEACSFQVGCYAGFGLCSVFWLVPEFIRYWRNK